MSPKLEALDRWRLILGRTAENQLGQPGATAGAMQVALDWLYERQEGDGEDQAGERDLDKRRGGEEASKLTVPEWISQIHELFPQETIERLERDAVERYQIHEVVTNLEVLRRVEPSETLLQAVLQTRHLMNPEVLAAARELVVKVVHQLMEKFQSEIRHGFSGALDRRRSTRFRSARNLDFRRTLRSNLHRYSPRERKLYLEEPYFFSRTKRHSERWQVLILVDQSGSMVASVIHAAITAACFWSLPGMSTHLIAFDTSVVDLTADVQDPVELLLKVQLGGGTDIQQAVAYAAEKVTSPRKTLLVLISDFYEGAPPGLLVARVAALVESGVCVLGLAALDPRAQCAYDRELAQKLVNVGAEVGAMTPGQLAAWIGEKVRR